MYRVENSILLETEFSGVFRPRPLGEIAFSFSQCTSSHYELLHQGDAIVNSPSGLVVKTPLQLQATTSSTNKQDDTRHQVSERQEG